LICRNRLITETFTIANNFRTHYSLDMACEFGEEDGLDEKYEQPNLDQNQKILVIKKANVNF
jgi:hypothetical protein